MDRAGSLFRALEAEWRLDGFGRRAGEHVAGWARREPVLAGFGSPGEVVARCNARTDPEWSSAALAALLRLSASDPLAGRTVLQAVLPGLAGVVRRARAASLSDPDGWEHEVVAIAWEQIRALSADPPEWPAMAIVNLTWRRVRTAIDRRRRYRTATAPLEDSPAPAGSGTRSTGEQLLLILGEAVRRGTITRDGAQVIARTRVLGFTPAETATAAGRTAPCVYKLRERAERALVDSGGWVPAAS